MVLPMHKLASYLIDARDSVQIQLSQQYADKNKNQEKLYISSKLAGTTMCKSLGVSVGSEKSRLGLNISPEDEQSILFETSRPNRLFSEPTLALRDFTHGCTHKFTIVFIVTSSDEVCFNFI